MNTTVTKPNISFNINQVVRIKLTPHGRAFHAMQHAMFNMQTCRDIKYVPPVEDADGWSEWRLHEVMNQFGEQCYCGNVEVPFETTIQLVQES